MRGLFGLCWLRFCKAHVSVLGNGILWDGRDGRRRCARLSQGGSLGEGVLFDVREVAGADLWKLLEDIVCTENTTYHGY